MSSCNLRTCLSLLGSASCSVLRSVRKLQSLMFATSGGFAQFDKLRENV